MTYRPLHGPELPVRWVWVALAVAFGLAGKMWGVW